MREQGQWPKVPGLSLAKTSLYALPDTKRIITRKQMVGQYSEMSEISGSLKLRLKCRGGSLISALTEFLSWAFSAKASFCTRSNHRLNVVSEICTRQPIAFRNVSSISLISAISSPDILLQALARKFSSSKYFDANMSATRNIRRPHCIFRESNRFCDCTWESRSVLSCGLRFTK